MATYPDHIAALRDELKKRGLNGFVIPLTDEHMSEYVADYAKRLAWLTGFTGSAGSAVVLEDKAAIFIDGRYTIQVAEQVDEAIFAYVDYPDTTPADWLKKNVSSGAKIGFDPWLHSRDWVYSTQTVLRIKGADLVACETNPIDSVWTDKPSLPTHPLKAQEDGYAGRGVADKLKSIAASVRDAGADVCVLAALDSVAWAFNIRGSDIENTPVGLAFALVYGDGRGQLFTDLAKVNTELRAHLGSDVEIFDRSEFLEYLGKTTNNSVLLDPSNCVAALFDTVEKAGGTVIRGRDPVVLPKACKNDVEQEGARAAHRRDGAAVAQFLHWFSNEAPKGELDEISAAKHLESCRRRLNLFQDLSFRTISAAGPHAAIPHYSVDEDSNLPIDKNSVFLIDSGGQYLDGTTDITRTIAVGEVSDEAKRCFTLVLKGHIALATARFPKGTPGRALDTLARFALWQEGLDFDHGTGHGVGSYLSVHEGPQRIAKANSDEPLQQGMILSNEPGYYKAGEFGIRIENLVMVQPRPMPGDEREMYGLETITFAPIDQNMIIADLLNDEEKRWLNAYHAQVREILLPQVAADTGAWIEQATAPLL